MITYFQMMHDLYMIEQSGALHFYADLKHYQEVAKYQYKIEAV